MKQFLKALAFVCLCVPLWGQGYRYDSNAFNSANNVPAGSQSTMFTVPFAQITVCAYPDDGGHPCTNTVPIYQDSGLTVAAANPITADVHGRFGFWKAAGFYTYSVVSPNGTFLGTFIISLGGAGSPITFQTNTVNNLSQTLLDLDQGNNVTITNTSGGHVRIDTTAGLAPFINSPAPGQYVDIYPSHVTTSTLNNVTVTADANGTVAGANAYFSAAAYCAFPGTATATFSAFALPSYVNPANVTAVYAIALSGNYTFTATGTCISVPQSANINAVNIGASGTGIGPVTLINSGNLYSLQQSTGLLSGLTGANVPTVQIAATAGNGGDFKGAAATDVPLVFLRVYYTGTPPPTLGDVYIQPPLTYSNVTGIPVLGISPEAAFPGTSLLATNIPNLASSSNALQLINNGANATDCSTGGGTNVVLCYWNGTTWSAFATGGASGVTSINGSSGAFTFSGPGVNCTTTSCLFPSGLTGSGITGYLPAWTSSTALGNSHIDDGVTTASTLTAHEAVAVTDGTGKAGAVGLGQGTAAANSTTAVTLTVPTSVTSYRLQFPGAQPTLGNTYLSCTAADPAVCSWTSAGTGSSPLTTKGDLYGFNTANARIPVGTDGQVLTADSTQALGVKWAAGGGGNTTSTSLTTNVLPKANGANSIINSSVSDNGTTVTSSEPLVISVPGAQGYVDIKGSTSGDAYVGAAAVAGTPSTWLMPTTDPTVGQVLSAAAPASCTGYGTANCTQLSWATSASALTFSPPYICNGATCYDYDFYQVTKPLVCASQVYIGSTTGLTCTDGANGGVAFFSTTASAAYWTKRTATTSVEGVFRQQCGSQNCNNGIWIYDSTNGFVYSITLQAVNNTSLLPELVVNKFTYSGGSTQPAYSSTPVLIPLAAALTLPSLHFKLSASGGTLTCSYSFDGGSTYQTLTTISVGTITAGGFTLSPGNSTAYDQVNLISMAVN